MGTRNLTAAVIDGDFKIAQYGQWDGYPSGQGDTLLTFLRNLIDANRIVEFEGKLRGCTFLTNDEIRACWTAVGADNSGFVSMTIADKFKAANPQLSRDTGAEVFALVLNSENGLPLDDDHNFAGDSLFCEYAYVADFDKRTFEAYRGFNKEPVSADERFAKVPVKTDSKYAQVRLVASWPFDSLPNLDQLEAAYGSDDDSDEAP